MRGWKSAIAWFLARQPRNPRTVEEAVNLIVARLDPATIQEISQQTFREFRSRLGEDREFAMGIRNGLGLWSEISELIPQLPEWLRFPDNAYAFLMDCVWERLNPAGAAEYQGYSVIGELL